MKKLFIMLLSALSVLVMPINTALATHGVVCSHELEVVRILKEPTCSEGGEEEARCKICGYSCIRSINSLGHWFETTKIISEATCTENGKDEAVCTTCGLTTVREIVFLGHIKGEHLEHIDSTCSVQGYDSYYCERCNTDYKVYIEMPEHSYERISSTEATCTEDGVDEYVCTVCKERDVRTTAFAAHSYVEKESVEVTCETDGRTVSVCTVCKSEDVFIVEAPGHCWDNGTKLKEEGLFEDGIVVYTCLADPSHTTEEVVLSKYSSDNAFHYQIFAIAFSVVFSAGFAAVIRSFDKGRVRRAVKKHTKRI